MAFSTIGHIVFGVSTAEGTTSQILGSSIKVDQWTTLGYTYSQANVLIMYIIGVQYGTTGVSSYTARKSIGWLNVGWRGSGCEMIPIISNYFLGAVDELDVYRRELTTNEIASLANH
jgi:hypothetical protein